jgi:hypothetical protein
MRPKRCRAYLTFRLYLGLEARPFCGRYSYHRWVENQFGYDNSVTRHMTLLCSFRRTWQHVRTQGLWRLRLGMPHAATPQRLCPFPDTAAHSHRLKRLDTTASSADCQTEAATDIDLWPEPIHAPRVGVRGYQSRLYRSYMPTMALGLGTPRATRHHTLLRQEEAPQPVRSPWGFLRRARPCVSGGKARHSEDRSLAQTHSPHRRNCQQGAAALIATILLPENASCQAQQLVLCLRRPVIPEAHGSEKSGRRWQRDSSDLPRTLENARIPPSDAIPRAEPGSCLLLHDP